MSFVFRVGSLFTALAWVFATAPEVSGASGKVDEEACAVPIKSHVLLQVGQRRQGLRSFLGDGAQLPSGGELLQPHTYYELREHRSPQPSEMTQAQKAELAVRQSQQVEGGGAEAPTLEELHLLDMHNHYRCMHGGPNLVWDDVLEASARVVADLGVWAVSPQEMRVGLGENLFWGSFPQNVETTFLAVKDWYREKEDYSYETTYSKNDLKMVGRFTQVVWEASIKLGCSRGTLKNRGGQFWVCHYEPRGNVRLLNDEKKYYNENVKQKVADEQACPSPETMLAEGGNCSDEGQYDHPLLKFAFEPLACEDLKSFCNIDFVMAKCRATCGDC